MANIIAARFDTQEEADRAISALDAAGIAPGERASFYLNPPGQHAEYPIGGDAHHDEGTKKSGKTAGVGAAVGSVAGLAIGTVTGAALGEGGLTVAAAIAGAGVGGYVGSLAGGLSGAESGEVEKASVEEPVERTSGIMVAARVGDGGEEALLSVFRRAGALEIERADGDLRDGNWVDFDPRRPPRLVGADRDKGPEGPAGERG